MIVSGGRLMLTDKDPRPCLGSLSVNIRRPPETIISFLVSHGMEIEPNSIYLIPPKKEMIVSGGRLMLTDKDPKQGLALPIDIFLRSLAQDRSEEHTSELQSRSDLVCR